MQWHQTEGFMCQICDFKLNTESELQKHLDLHKGKSDLQCVIRDKDKMYPKFTHLRRHVKIHVN